MHFFSRLSLSGKLIFIAILIGGVFATLTVMRAAFMHGAREQAVSRQIETYSGLLSDGVANEFGRLYYQVQSIANDPRLASGDRLGASEVLESQRALHPDFDLLVLVDASGAFLASNKTSNSGLVVDLEALRSHPFARSRWFRAVGAGEFSEQPAAGLSGTFVEDVEFGTLASIALGEPRFTTGFSAPVHDGEGQLVGVLTGRANFRWAERPFASLYSRLAAQGMGEVELTMLDAKGRVLIDYDPTSNGGRREVKHDPEVLKRLNLAERGVAAAESLVRGESGAFVALHARKKIDQFTGFTPVQRGPVLESLGWGTLVRLPIDDTRQDRAMVYTVIFVSLVLFILVATVIGRRVGGSLMEITTNLDAVVSGVLARGDSLSASSRAMSDSAQLQAAAVQESVASMAEMRSMIGQTSEATRECDRLASRAKERSADGERTMTQFTTSMAAITEANESLRSLASIIQEISSRAGVINDIVFKTQLLSFNASIEAARAGEHGKGFAVVAEEVGNLARMSGEAANEIDELLSRSQHEVDDVIRTVRERTQGAEEVSSEAEAIFSVIAGDVEQLSVKIESIRDATRQQEEGVVQATLAMEQMAETTRQNERASVSSAKTAVELRAESSALNGAKNAIAQIVMGGGYRDGHSPMSGAPSPLNPLGNTVVNIREDDTGDLDAAASDLLGPSAQPELLAPGLDANDPSFRRPAA